MLCTHKTASSASLVLEICHQFNNSFLHQFSSIFGGNCITMQSGKQFINTLEDNICRHSAMDRLISCSAKHEISHKVKDILRTYNIYDWQSEPYHQNQNPAEWWYRTIKALANTLMNRTGAPAYCWVLTLQYMCYILNHISTASLGGQVPLQVL